MPENALLKHKFPVICNPNLRRTTTCTHNTYHIHTDSYTSVMMNHGIALPQAIQYHQGAKEGVYLISTSPTRVHVLIEDLYPFLLLLSDGVLYRAPGTLGGNITV